MKLGVLAFGVFCLFIAVAGMIFVASMASSQPDYTDTYGNTLDATAAQSEDLVTGTVDTSGAVMLPIILIGGVILLIAVLFALWTFSKTGISI